MNLKEVKQVFVDNELCEVSSVEKVEIGFTNKVYSVNNKFILKVCEDETNELNFEKEAYFYKFFDGKIPVPKVILYDNSKKEYSKSIMVYHKIKGENLYSKWHLLSDEIKKEIIKQLCQILKKINNSPYKGFVRKFKLKHSINWHDKIIKQIDNHLKKSKKRKLLPTELISKIKDFVDTNHKVLKKQKITLVYWDVHFDNIIIENNKITGLLDFERTELASIDFTLDVVKRMVKYPKKYMAEKFEKLAKKKDYAQLLNWFKEFYPELFAFENLNKRLDLYSIEHDLATLLDYPHSKATKKMIAKTINYKSPI